MAVSTADIKKLREKTGAGMLDCRKALVEADGDLAGAEKIIKEWGKAVAQKRVGKATKEGRVFTKILDKSAGICEISCETDFVVRNKEFIQMGDDVVNAVAEKGLSEVTDDLKEKVEEAISKIKENMSLRRVASMTIAENEYVHDYIHGEGKIGILIKLKLENAQLKDKDEVKEFANDCALHAAAFNPAYLSQDKVDDAYLKEQEEIFTVQAKNTGKPDNIVQGIAKGKLKKHLAQICFLDQPFVKNDKISVSQAAAETSKAAGGKIELIDYMYFQTGEELE